MPLIHSKSPGAFKTNVRTLMHDVGKSPHVQSRQQALAIAYSTARRAKAKMAAGGHGKPTDIIAAGGEIVIPPHKIIEKYGDLDKGHKALDRWVVKTRKKHIKTLKNLKPPRQD